MRSSPRAPLWIPEGSPHLFPDPHDFDEHGLIAGGGDLHPERLLAAYRRGIFPWYDHRPILWWSPDPRAIVSAESLHVSRSLRRTLRSTGFTVTAGTALAEVMRGCAEREEGTWLNQEMQEAYLELGRQGHALSYEVWDGRDLVGGLYGVVIGAFFAAESKFHRRTDASKIALVCAATDLFDRGLLLFDVQFVTEHLSTLGVHEVSRASYLSALALAAKAALRPASPDSNLLPRVRRRLCTSD